MLICFLLDCSLIGMVKGFLESKDPAVRIAAGEMIAVVYEQIMGAEQYSVGLMYFTIGEM